jgi:hypothetical protein
VLSPLSYTPRTMDERVGHRARDAALIASLIITGPFCRPCIEQKTQVTGTRLRALNVWAHPYIGMAIRRTKCQGCGTTRRTYQIG